MAGTEVNMEAPIIKVEQRITVALVSKAAADLTATHERSKLSKTDIVNRAISLYEFLDKELGSGSELLLRRRDGSTHLVKLC
jgi:hypothetical protein